MAKRNISVGNIIKEVFNNKKELTYTELLASVKKLYFEKNKIIFNKSDGAECNNRLKDFIKKKQIGFSFDIKLNFSEYTSLKVNIPRKLINCNLYWIDTSVHDAVVEKIIKTIKDDFSQNIITITNKENITEYNLSQIKIINNNVNTIYLDFYEFRIKNDALKKFNKESTFNYEIPYKFWDKDKINELYKLNIEYNIKAYMLYPVDSKLNWYQNHLFENIKVFVNVNNYYIIFTINQNELEYIIKLANKIVTSIYKQELSKSKKNKN